MHAYIIAITVFTVSLHMFLPVCMTVLWLPMHVSSDPTFHEYYVVRILLIVVFDDVTQSINGF